MTHMIPEAHKLYRVGFPNSARDVVAHCESCAHRAAVERWGTGPTYVEEVTAAERAPFSSSAGLASFVGGGAK